MKSCSLCGNNSIQQPKLCFYGLPKHRSVKEEWLEVLGPNKKTTGLYVCEVHFRPLDFSAGPKKELKPHAVPVLKLGKGVNDPVGSDDEFLDISSGGDCKTEKPLSPIKIKSEPLSDDECIVKQEPIDEEEKCDTRRRPSRRAAIVAAQKISSSSCIDAFQNDPDYSLPASPESPGAVADELEAEDSEAEPEDPGPVISKTPLVKHILIVKPPSPINISLDMECYDEALSETQTEVLSEAQNQYNLVMKGLKDLVQCSSKVLQTDSTGTKILSTLPVSTQTVPTIPAPVKPIQSNSVFLKSDNAKVVPLSLASTNTQPSYVII